MWNCVCAGGWFGGNRSTVWRGYRSGRKHCRLILRRHPRYGLPLHLIRPRKPSIRQHDQPGRRR